MHRRYKNAFYQKTSKNDQQLKLCKNLQFVYAEIMDTHSFTIASKKMVIMKIIIQLKAIYRFNADK